jgi:hypothetical protein
MAAGGPWSEAWPSLSQWANGGIIAVPKNPTIKKRHKNVFSVKSIK